MSPQAMVNWNNPVKKRRVLSNGRTCWETRFPVTCPVCDEDRLLTSSDARKAIRNNSPCFRCSQRGKGKLGFAAVGGNRARRRIKWRGLQTFRQENPSDLEKQVSAILDDLGIEYVFNDLLESSGGRFYLPDFTFEMDGQRYCIEVNGSYYHSLPGRARIWRNKKSLLTRRGYKTLVIPEEKVADAQTMIVRFLNMELQTA